MSDANTVLIIDDERSLLRLIQIFLQRKGFNVLVALSVEEGRTLLKENSDVKLIILDLMMPNENGFNFLTWLNEDGIEFKEIPIIVNTAKNLTDEEREFLEKNVKKIMNKGIDFSDRIVQEVKSFF